MRYLHIGDTVRAVTDGVAQAWTALTAQAEQEAEQGNGHPMVFVRTDRGASGAIPIHSDVAITITEDGFTTEPDFGVIVQASTKIDDIHDALVAEHGPEPEKSDAEVEELVQQLKDDRPDLDWDNLLMGRLAGPASPDRPDVPIWEYLSYAESHPEVRFSDLTAARFPVRFFEGPASVTSIDEELKPFPSSYKGTPPKSRYTETPHTVIGRYAALHQAGVLAWDPTERGITYLTTMGAYRAVLNTWASTLANTE